MRRGWSVFGDRSSPGFEIRTRTGSLNRKLPPALRCAVMQSPCATILRLTCVALFLAVHGAVLTQQARTREPKIRQATRIGRVVDPAEGAIADAELRLIDSATQNVIASARTRDSGAFALDVSAVDERTTLVVTANDFAERRLSSDELQRTGTLLRLRPAATMTGRVTDGQKRPVAESA